MGSLGGCRAPETTGSPAGGQPAARLQLPRRFVGGHGASTVSRGTLGIEARGRGRGRKRRIQSGDGRRSDPIALPPRRPRGAVPATGPRPPGRKWVAAESAASSSGLFSSAAGRRRVPAAGRGRRGASRASGPAASKARLGGAARPGRPGAGGSGRIPGAGVARRPRRQASRRGGVRDRGPGRRCGGVVATVCFVLRAASVGAELLSNLGPRGRVPRCSAHRGLSWPGIQLTRGSPVRGVLLDRGLADQGLCSPGRARWPVGALLSGGLR